MENNEYRQTFFPGEVFAKRYKINRLLGIGGMGEVYLAHDRLLDNALVAVKFLNIERIDNEKQIQRFLREIALTRKVNSSNVVQTFDASVAEEQLYYVMEYIDGINLHEKLLLGSLSVNETLRILSSLVTGLKAIHEAGIIHRDLKPENILITKKNEIKITDFGVAKSNQSNLTTDGEVVGSSSYMSPECWKGDDASFKADVYSLGVIAYEMLTSKVPFDGETMAQTMYKHLEGSLIPPNKIVKDLPQWLNDLIEVMLEIDPVGRPDLSEVEEALNKKEFTNPHLNQDFSETFEEVKEVKEEDLLVDPKFQFEQPQHSNAYSYADFQPEKSEPLKKLVVNTSSYEGIFSFGNLFISCLLSLAVIYGLIFYGGKHLDLVFQGILFTHGQTLWAESQILIINSLFYSIFFTLPVFVFIACAEDLKGIIFKTLGFYTFSFVLCIIISFIYANQLLLNLAHLQGASDVVKLSLLNLCLPQAVSHLLEASMLFSSGTAFTLSPGNAQVGFETSTVTFNPATWIYYDVLILYIFAMIMFNQKSIAYSSFSLRKIVSLPILFLALFITEEIIRANLLKFGIIPVDHLTVTLGVYDFSFDFYNLVCAFVNWPILFVFLFSAIDSPADKECLPHK